MTFKNKIVGLGGVDDKSSKKSYVIESKGWNYVKDNIEKQKKELEKLKKKLEILESKRL